jgi:hypothetical protein
VKIILETEKGSVPVAVMLLWGKGERVERYVLFACQLLRTS